MVTYVDDRPKVLEIMRWQLVECEDLVLVSQVEVATNALCSGSAELHVDKENAEQAEGNTRVRFHRLLLFEGRLESGQLLCMLLGSARAGRIVFGVSGAIVLLAFRLLLDLLRS